MLYMFEAVSLPIIRSSKTVHTASGICQACLLLPLAVSLDRAEWSVTKDNKIEVNFNI